MGFNKKECLLSAFLTSKNHVNFKPTFEFKNLRLINQKSAPQLFLHCYYFNRLMVSFYSKNIRNGKEQKYSFFQPNWY